MRENHQLLQRCLPLVDAMGQSDLQGVLEEEEKMNWMRIITIICLAGALAGHLWMYFRGMK